MTYNDMVRESVLQRKMPLMTLLDRLKAAMNSQYLSDLRRLNRLERSCMADILTQIPPEDYPLNEWNDALEYLTGVSGKPSTEDAKISLVALLDQSAAKRMCEKR